MIKVYFHKSLQKYSKVKEHSFDVIDFSSLVSGVKELFPELDRYQNSLCNRKEMGELCVYIYEKKHIVPESWLIKSNIPENGTELWLVPSVYGGGKAGKIIAGIALVALGVFLGQAFAGTNTLTILGFDLAKGILGIGINLILGSLLSSQLSLDKPASPLDSGVRRNNDFFDGLSNTVDSGKLVPLNYGLMRTGGHLASGYIKTLNHGKDETILVGEQFK